MAKSGKARVLSEAHNSVFSRVKLPEHLFNVQHTFDVCRHLKPLSISGRSAIE
jgi:hypothetical protein